jgi:outer membrane lipoprotein-sorting protein
LTNNEDSNIINTGSKIMNILPNADKAIIPIEKLLNYSLDYDKDPNKATAFHLALGYSKKNAGKLIENIKSNIQKYSAIHKGNNGYGDIYELVLNLKGENGKNANVLTAWIVDNGVDIPRLMNVYVTKKDVTR